MLTCLNLTYGQFFELVETDFSKSKPGRTVGFIDVNQDGFLDVFIAYGSGKDDLFINDGEGNLSRLNWTNVAERSVGGSWIDIENDGDLDHYQGTWYGKNNYLIIDEEDDYRISSIDNISIPSHTESVSWADVDNNGYLDVYIANSKGEANVFGINFGDLNFENKIINDSEGESRCAVWGDYNDDGFQDLLVTNESGDGSYLYKNEGGILVRQKFSLIESFDGFGASWGDMDNDGDLDLFIARFGSSNVILENLGSEKFAVLENSGIREIQLRSIGSTWGDIDNDGDLDLFVTGGYENGTSNELYLNNGNKTFSPVFDDESVAGIPWSYGAALGDMDNDGDLDLLVANTTDDSDKSSLYKNIGNENHWIILNLEGVVSNRLAIGSRVTLYQSFGGSPTIQTREVASTSGYSGINDFRVHFGLGSNAVIDSIIVKWPGGNFEKIINPASNQILTVKESIQNGYIQSNFILEGEKIVGTDISFINTTRSDPDLDNEYEWDFDNDGTIDSTEESPVHSFQSGGTFEVSLQSSNALSTSVIIRKVKIKKALNIFSENLTEYLVFPNPSFGHFTFTSKENIKTAGLYTLSGKKLYFDHQIIENKLAGSTNKKGILILIVETSAGKKIAKRITLE